MAFISKESPSLLSGLYPQRLIKPQAPGIFSGLGKWLEIALWRRRFRLARQQSIVQSTKNYPDLCPLVSRVLTAWEKDCGIPSSDEIISATQALLHNRSLVELNILSDCEEASCLASLVKALSGVPVYMIYAEVPKEPESLLNVAEKLGLKVAVLQDGQSLEERRDAYTANITLVSFRQLMFDYMLDERLFVKQKGRLSGRLQRRIVAPNGPLLKGLSCGIVIDARTVLIDHADRPVAISEGESKVDSHVEIFYQEAINVARELCLDRDYAWSALENVPVLLESGVQKISELSLALGPLWRGVQRANNAVCASLIVLRLIEGVDYKIEEGQVSIEKMPLLVATVDSISGPDWKQLVVAKHDLQSETGRPTIKRRLSLQHFFPRFLHLSAAGYLLEPRRREMEEVYGLLSVPQYAAQKTKKTRLEVFKTSEKRYQAAALLIEDSIINQKNILIVSRDQEMMTVLHETLSTKFCDALLSSEKLGEQTEVGGLFFSVTIGQALDKIEEIGELGEFHNIFFVDTPSGMLEEYLICSALLTQGKIRFLASPDEVVFASCSKALHAFMPYSKYAYNVMRKSMEVKERQGRMLLAEHDAYLRQSLAFSGSFQ